MKKASVAGTLFLLASLTLLSAQQASNERNSSTEPGSSVMKVVVDQDCRILEDPETPATEDSEGRWRPDEYVCHLEGRGHYNSEHVEERIREGVQELSRVWVIEQTHLLQDVTDAPEVFEVREFVPEGWHMDSDPQPVETVDMPSRDGAIAIFRVNAVPGEIVHLHTGMRHTEMIKEQPAEVVAPASSVN